MQRQPAHEVHKSWGSTSKIWSGAIVFLVDPTALSFALPNSGYVDPGPDHPKCRQIEHDRYTGDREHVHWGQTMMMFLTSLCR